MCNLLLRSRRLLLSPVPIHRSAQSFLEKAGARFEFTEPGDGPAYLATDMSRRLASAVLVYGTNRDAGANRYAAEQLQRGYLEQYESKVPVYKNCTAMHAKYKHGVGRKGARDKVTSGKPVTNFYVSTTIYNANKKLDRDRDGVACEKH